MNLYFGKKPSSNLYLEYISLSIYLVSNISFIISYFRLKLSIKRLAFSGDGPCELSILTYDGDMYVSCLGPLHVQPASVRLSSQPANSVSVTIHFEVITISMLISFFL